MLILRVALAAVFVVSAVAKAARPHATAASARELGVPAALSLPVAVILPIVEAAVAAALLVTSTAGLGGVAGAVVMAAFTALVLTNLARGRRPGCACFGALTAETPIGAPTVARNLALLTASVAVAVLAYAPWGGAQARGCEAGCYDGAGLWSLAGAGVVLMVAGTAVSLALAASLSKLVGQLVQRVRALEEMAGLDSGEHTPKAVELPEVDSHLLAGVLADGSVTDAFGDVRRVADLVAEEALMAESGRAMVLFFSASCGACTDVRRRLDAARPASLGFVSLINRVEVPLAGTASGDAVRGTRLEMFRDSADLADAGGVQFFPTALVVDAAMRPVGPALVGARDIMAHLDTVEAVAHG